MDDGSTLVDLLALTQGNDVGLVLADLDGCLIAGDSVLPGARALVEAAADRLWIVSNNSTETAATLAFRLKTLGLPIPPDRILLAGEQTIVHLAETGQATRLAVFAAEPLRALARQLGFIEDRTSPDVSVLARDPRFGLNTLNALSALALRGVPIWLTNPDCSHPGPDGLPRAETGALWAALTAIVPVKPAGCLGKPATTLIEMAIKRAGVRREQVVFLGDTPATDGAAAAAAGVRFVQRSRPAVLQGAASC